VKKGSAILNSRNPKGSAMAVVDCKELKGAEVGRLVKKLYEGALQHPKAAPLWREWCVE
jgi:hypothetical protein